MTFEKRVIGDCTLYRGDSLALLNAGVFGKIGAIVSDPPYGIGFQHGSGGNPGQLQNPLIPVGNLEKIYGDDAPFDPMPWVDAAPSAYGNQSQLGSLNILLFGADHFRRRLPDGGTLLAWDKHLGRGADDSFADCEWMWCGRKVKREVFRYLWKGVVAQKSALDMPPPSVKGGNGKGAAAFARIHISQKPVELMRWCIDKVRPLTGLPILDPYMGSGSTAIAALSLGHSFIGCEIDPVHFDVACRRIQAFYDRQNGGEQLHVLEAS